MNFPRLSLFSDTLWLGTRNRFNEQLNGTTARYTYFVPRDRAWKSLENEYPSVYKKLFMPDFSYHVRTFKIICFVIKIHKETKLFRQIPSWSVI